MLDFVKRAFRGGLEAILWINLILSTIAGGIAGYYLGQLISYRNAGGYAFGGVIIGIILGLLIDIIGGGFITTILSIEKNIEDQNSLLKKYLCKNISNSETSDTNCGELVEKDRNNLLNEGDMLVVQREITLKDKAGTDGKETIPLNRNDLVKYIGSVNNVGIYPWYFVETKTGERGYYVSLDFKKETEK